MITSTKKNTLYLVIFCSILISQSICGPLRTLEWFSISLSYNWTSSRESSSPFLIPTKWSSCPAPGLTSWRWNRCRWAPPILVAAPVLKCWSDCALVNQLLRTTHCWLRLKQGWLLQLRILLLFHGFRHLILLETVTTACTF